MPIKVENGDGVFFVNGNTYTKRKYPAMKLKADRIRLGTFKNTIDEGHFSEFRDGDDQSFASQQAVLDYLQTVIV